MSQLKKSSKGTVGIESFRNKLRLRLPRTLGVTKRYISTGLDDTPENRKKAQIAAWEIESDTDNHQIDLSLEKYRQHFTQPKLTLISTVKPQMTLGRLWDAYMEYRKPKVAPNTYNNLYKCVASHVDKCPEQSLDNALAIRDYFLNNLSAYTAKKYITQINAAASWGIEYGYVSSNPFEGMAKKIKVKPKSPEDIKPFTAQERDAIIEAFNNDPRYSYYTNFVKFLFMTGCRTGEAIGLKWKHISPDCRKITFSESYTRGFRKSTKTGKSRFFPCNTKLQTFLKSIKPSNTNPEDLVFPSPSGKEIDNHNFLGRAWKGSTNRHGNFTGGIVTRLVKEGKVSEYRCVYNTRHTFISMALETGISPQQIAKWVGNTAKIIMDYYAGVVTQIEVPEF